MGIERISQETFDNIVNAIYCRCLGRKAAVHFVLDQVNVEVAAPPTRTRPLTADEWFEAMKAGRKVIIPSYGLHRSITSVGEDHVVIENCGAWKLDRLERFTWADTGKRCEVEE